jgi:nucleoside-triphosphatase THEP1
VRFGSEKMNEKLSGDSGYAKIYNELVDKHNLEKKELNAWLVKFQEFNNLPIPINTEINEKDNLKIIEFLEKLEDKISEIRDEIRKMIKERS